MDGKAILSAVIAFILYLVFAIVYFIILGFIIKVSVDLVVGSGAIDQGSLAIATAILTAGTIVAGGGISSRLE